MRKMDVSTHDPFCLDLFEARGERRTAYVKQAALVPIEVVRTNIQNPKRRSMANKNVDVLGKLLPNFGSVFSGFIHPAPRSENRRAAFSVELDSVDFYNFVMNELNPIAVALEKVSMKLNVAVMTHFVVSTDNELVLVRLGRKPLRKGMKVFVFATSGHVSGMDENIAHWNLYMVMERMSVGEANDFHDSVYPISPTIYSQWKITN